MKVKALVSIAALSALILSANVFAAPIPESSDIPLGGGTIAPATTYSIPLNALISNIMYDVHCDVKDANNASNPAIIYVETSNKSQPLWVRLNGKLMESLQFALNAVQNDMVAIYIAQNEQALDITNADQSDSLEVNCTAVAEGSK